ncbi:hypothetical protein [Mesonia sp. K7]|uniref:hypothetical protein n=1 Tax=Mesonia sp. K7 TaxID=2218606 RepID=UPI000DA782EB|nr:hypothetical protein [Mesonia sp. K7]PZD76610.1 hypothetical protein DNG35_11510 [Mesonia sp. K7]
MKKSKVIHLHTDIKFLFNTENFEGDFFDNIIIFIGEEGNRELLDKNLFFIEKAVNKIPEILRLCQSAELVVLYDLDSFKQQLVLKFPDTVKIAWRFFGYELYAKRPDLFKSELSRKHDLLSFKKRNRRKLSFLFKYMRSGNNYSQRYNRVLNRIDYFLALSNEEYQLLKQYWINLPTFVKLPHFHYDKKLVEIDFQKKEMENPLIIVGNNRSSYNNHLDIIDLIEKYENRQNYNFTLFFNYGAVGKYAKKVMERTRNNNHYTLITNFLDKQNFVNTYQKATGLVINGYRQMAGANIYMALKHGVNVYLNNKNVHKQFLENQGFKIFSIEDFETDLKNNNLGLDKEMALKNMENFKRFSEAYTKEDFQRQLSQLLKAH